MLRGQALRGRARARHPQRTPRFVHEHRGLGMEPSCSPTADSWPWAAGPVVIGSLAGESVRRFPFAMADSDRRTSWFFRFLTRSQPSASIDSKRVISLRILVASDKLSSRRTASMDAVTLWLPCHMDGVNQSYCRTWRAMAAPSASRTLSMVIRSKICWKNPVTIMRIASPRVNPRD